MRICKRQKSNPGAGIYLGPRPLLPRLARQWHLATSAMSRPITA